MEDNVGKEKLPSKTRKHRLRKITLSELYQYSVKTTKGNTGMASDRSGLETETADECLAEEGNEVETKMHNKHSSIRSVFDSLSSSALGRSVIGQEMTRCFRNKGVGGEQRVDKYLSIKETRKVGSTDLNGGGMEEVTFVDKRGGNIRAQFNRHKILPHGKFGDTDLYANITDSASSLPLKKRILATYKLMKEGPETNSLASKLKKKTRKALSCCHGLGNYHKNTRHLSES